MLLAEMLVLLALDDDGRVARGASTQPAVALGVTGALITDLVLDGHLDLTDGRIRPGKTRPTDPLLDHVLTNVEPHAGKKLKSRLASIKHAGWREVVDRMVERGVLGREKPPLRPTRHPVTDPAAHAELIATVQAAARADTPLDATMATLLALAGPCQMLEIVAPERSERGHAKRRIEEAATQVPAAPAVRAAIEAVQAAVITSIAATSAATTVT
jgi:hypothetical protein